MPQVEIAVVGLAGVEAAIRECNNPRCIAAIVGPSLGAAAGVIRRRAKTRGFVFQDRTRRLRRSIRSRRTRDVIAGKKIRGAGAQVRAGGEGARQAYLVEAGHGGPWPARPYPYLEKALLETRSAQETAFITKAKERTPVVMTRYVKAKGDAGASVRTVYARTVARRGRGRFR